MLKGRVQVGVKLHLHAQTNTPCALTQCPRTPRSCLPANLSQVGWHGVWGGAVAAAMPAVPASILPAILTASLPSTTPAALPAR